MTNHSQPAIDGADVFEPRSTLVGGQLPMAASSGMTTYRLDRLRHDAFAHP